MDSIFFLFPILWFGLIFTIIIWSLVIEPGKDKERVRSYLQQRGARAITVNYHWFGSNKAHRSYEVRYQDATGIWYNTSCVISAYLWGDKSIYWLESPQFAAKPLPESSSEIIPMLPWMGENFTSAPASPKDKLISKLLEDNKRLRRELQRMQSTVLREADTP